ncbi:hypothetical protein Tco_1556504 [Tanacetum coccineum]
MRQGWWIELLSDYDCEIHYHLGKANVVAYALSRKDIFNQLRVRAINMKNLLIHIRDKILEAKKEHSGNCANQRITSITVNGKAAYDPIDLPNVNYEGLRLAVFPISLVGNASKWFDEFKGSITTWVDLSEKFFRRYYPHSCTCNVVRTEAKRDPTDTMFKKWLALKFANHVMMDPYTKKVLWDFWKKVDSQGVVTNEGFSDLEKANNDDEHKLGEIFRIETNLFDYETPLCMAFNEFNYLLKVDTELFTYDIERTKTYEDYENELNDESGKTKWPTCNSNEDGFCNDRELPGMVRGGKRKEGQCDLFDDPAQELPVCKIRRFEMIKYSFGQEEEYVAIKEYEYDDSTRTNQDACHAYQEIFRNMNEGCLVTRAE